MAFATFLDVKHLYIKTMPNDTRSRSRSANVRGVHLWLVLWKATRTIEGIARRNVEGLGLCLSDFGVLEALLHKGPLPVNTLGAKVLLTSGSMTAAVDRLERRRLVERKASPDDRRARLVHLTARGRRLIGGMFASHEQAIERAVAVLTAKQRATLLGLLRKLGRGAESWQGPPTASSRPVRTRGRAALVVHESKGKRQ
jgi:MarR family 2-MHQ and catechol resistance regulon transcriptional repressor